MKRLALYLAVCSLVVTAVIPSADDQLRMALNQRARQDDFVVVDPDEKWATVLIRLHPDVVQPEDDPDGDGDYPAIGKAILAIPGVTGFKLMPDGQCPDRAPAGDELRLYVEAYLRSHKIPEPPPEP